MKCPHCLVEFHQKTTEYLLSTDKTGGYSVLWMTCPKCKNAIVFLSNGKAVANVHGVFSGLKEPLKTSLVYPKGTMRPPCPTQVPPQIREDYKEACLVLGDSPKASAALSRRCLQNVLREASKVKPDDLSKEIQQVLDSGLLRPDIADGLDTVRAIGNFAAHPIKSKQTGEIMPVEPGEAEWNLDVLESLFDFYFVQPSILTAKKDALNKKLAEAGKPPVK